MVKTKKRAAARAKVPTTKSVPDGMQLFTVHLPGHLLNPPSEHVIAGTDEEDAAERICTRWEMDVNVVKVVRGDGRSFEVRGERSDGEWNSTSSEEITPPPVAPPVTPPPLPPPKPIPDFQCSFCGKQQREVNKLIAGPRVYICNECLVLSNEMCLKDGFDVVTPARGNVADDGKRFEAAKKDMERATEAAKKADEIAAFLRTGAETAIPEANKKLVELARHLGADIFTKVETRDLLHLAEDARKANLSLPEYIGVLKARISLYERVTRRTAAESLGTWVAATMDIGAGVVYAMGAELAKAARAKT